jgi:hypothetical protein
MEGTNMPKDIAVEHNARCRGRKLNGARCKVRGHINVLNGLCMFHDPRRKGTVALMRKRGGKAGGLAKAKRSKVPPPPTDLESAMHVLSWVTHAVSVGRIDPRRAQEMTRAATVYIRGVQVRDAERRMKKIEEKLKRLKAG